MQLRPGHIVKLKNNHPLLNLVPGNCVVIDVKDFKWIHSAPSYLIKSSQTGSSTWVRINEIDFISQIREVKLNSILGN